MQLVGYEPSGRGPALQVAEDERVVEHPLEPGTELAFSLGARRCAGEIESATDRHHPCDRPEAPYCPDHASTWICARCTGTCLKDEMDCFDEHAVYLAVFAPDTIKVGVTRRERLETRLTEQGADRGACIHTVSNGKIAREIEAEIAREIPDRVAVDRKVDGFGASVDEEQWDGMLAGYDVSERVELDYGFDLERRPVRETVATGRVIGVKGRILVLERGGTSYAVDMRDLVGHRVESVPDDRSRQSSLGSFGRP